MVMMQSSGSPSPPLPPDPTQSPFTMPNAQARQDPPAVLGHSPPLPAQRQSVPLQDPKQANVSRSRASSRPPPPVLHQQLPVDNAIKYAFDPSHVAQNQWDPELVRQVTEQVTEQVIKNLQSANLATPSASVQPLQAAQPAPTQSSIDPIPPRFTPPSPEKSRGRDEIEDGFSSPEPLHSDRDSTYSNRSMMSQRSARSSDTPRPTQADIPGGSKTGDAVAGSPRAYNGRHGRRDRSSQATGRESSQPLRRDSKDSRGGDCSDQTSRTGVPTTRTSSASVETTALEKAWQPLFDNGNPTARLGQFLRGLALHLIDDYEPRGNLVVTPAKMLRFFIEAKVSDEHYPWDVIFGNKIPSASVSKIYQKLFCQHHLVQTQCHEVPVIPGLTPHGFESFMTLLIQAHPDVEYERLSHAAMNMPISNADNKSERFPKELSRRLLPHQPNLQAKQRIVASLNHEPSLIQQLRGASSIPPPPPPSAPPVAFSERERQPYSSTPQSNVLDDDDLIPPTRPLERERKPYVAKEGAGKTYNTESQARPQTGQFKPDGVPIPARPSRTNSGARTQSSFNGGNSEPMSIPPPRNHRLSMGQGPPPAMTNGSAPKSGPRRTTPPPRHPYGRSSEPLDIGGIPPSQYASNPYYSSTHGVRDHFAGDPDEDTLRRYHSRRPTDRSSFGASHITDDDLAAGVRGYPISPRPPPSSQGYDANYAPAGGYPVGSYPRSGGGSSSADRRSTWYGPAMGGLGGGGGGSDGYGAFAGGAGTAGSYSYGTFAQH